jgi:hypothetical protein
LPKKKDEFEKSEDEGSFSFLYEDKIETVDREKRGKVTARRNEIIGRTSTVIKGKCSEAVLELHARIVEK